MSSPLADVLRWEESGGTWRSSTTPDGTVTVTLCRCDGGEVVDRIVSDDTALASYVATRPGSED